MNNNKVLGTKKKEEIVGLSVKGTKMSSPQVQKKSAVSVKPVSVKGKSVKKNTNLGHPTIKQPIAKSKALPSKKEEKEKVV